MLIDISLPTLPTVAIKFPQFPDLRNPAPFSGNTIHKREQIKVVYYRVVQMRQAIVADATNFAATELKLRRTA